METIFVILNPMDWTVADLCDTHEGQILVAQTLFQSFGQHSVFCGKIATVRCFEDNSLVRKHLKEDSGKGKVLVVDGHASMNCALLGDLLAEAAVKNHWQGIIVHGCVRDTNIINQLDIGVRALATHPRKSEKNNTGEYGVPVHFAGIDWIPDEYVYADHDGIIVAKEDLLTNE